jgi:hypothetical protein
MRCRGEEDQHLCPGGCSRGVPNDLYACGSCRRRLPSELQQAISAAVHEPVLSPSRTRVFTAAGRFFTAHPAITATSGTTSVAGTARRSCRC